MSSNQNKISRRDLFYELSLDAESPTPGLLRRLLQTYPQHAAALTQFAEHLALDSNPDMDVDEVPEQEVDQFVAPAMSRYQNRIYDQKQDATVRDVREKKELIDPFAKLSPPQFRALATELDVSTLFLVKLRDRLIEPETIPLWFTARIAEKASVPLEAYQAWQKRPPTLQTAARYRSDAKPTARERQDFADAVHTSGLSPAQQAKLLVK